MLDVRADLHAHSRHSDGWTKPVAVVELQAAHGVDLVSLTDHDTFDGVPAAMRRAAELGLGYVVGVEITAAPPRRMNHLLAHGVRADDADLGVLLAANRRIWRMDAMAARDHLVNRGLDVPGNPAYDDPDALVMPHTVARDVIRAGQARHAEVWAEIDASLASVPEGAYAEMPTAAEITEVVHGAGGLVVWAHPGQSMDGDAMRSVLHLIDAVEVFTPRHSRAVVAELRALCESTGKPYTTGWDFHGYPRYQRPPVPIDPRYLDLLADRVIRPPARGGSPRSSGPTTPDEPATP